MSDSYLRHTQLIKQWYERSQGEQKPFDIFDRFVSLWFSFNSWGGFVANTSVDAEVIRVLSRNSGLMATYVSLMTGDADFRKAVERLAEFEILDMRFPNRTGSKIANVDDLAQVLDAVYQIRCNLFHGQKGIDVPHDKELVELSFSILNGLFGPIVAGIV